MTRLVRAWHATGLLAAGLLLAFGASAADISVVGLFPGKAVLVINGAPPKTYSVGSSLPDGVKLISVAQDSAVLEIDGKRRAIAMGEHINRRAPSGPASVTLQADSRGHFVTNGQINGGAVRMLVDTGATTIALPASDAVRLGIDYKKGQIGYVSTANGTAPAYRVKLDTVRIGDITMNQVDATVMEGGLTIVLLGMSFLNRTEMRRDGEQMVLTKRF